LGTDNVTVRIYNKFNQRYDSKNKFSIKLINLILKNNKIKSLKKIEIYMPLVIRLAGTNVEKGNKILKESKINYIEASTLEDAANKAVKALKELGKN